jgi:alkanesulfonate monooxygenase SsuD/methylene tetrahydromethanopterin reductase-like flavin-dependent oxidoreductase (luciferase family)
MRVGVSLRSSYPVDDPRTGARWMVERARAADEAGLDSLFVGDHHATGPGAFYQNTPMLGRLLAEWGDRPAGVLFLLPLWNAVLAAEQIGTLASLARGRFVVQTAIGGGRQQFAAMGVATSGRAARFEAQLAVVRRLLAGEVVDDDTDGFAIRGARIAPIPAEPVEVWIGGGVPAAIDRAARLGDGFLANADIVPAEALEQAVLYRERCDAHGRAPRVVAIRRDVHVGPTDGAAGEVAEPIVRGGYRGFRPEALTYGSVERVAERFRELAAMGYTDVIVRQLASEQRDALTSIEQLAAVREAVADA